MTKALIIKASIVLGAFLVIIGISYGVSVIVDNDKVPTLENPDDVYVTVGDLTITNEELYEIMKQVDGYNFLLDYVDRIIVAEYLSNITDEEVEEQKLFEIYNTRDEEIVAEIQEDEDLNQEYLDLFEQRLITRGYNINNDGDVRAFTELTIARRKFAEHYVLNEDTEGTFKFTEEDINAYYTQNTKGDVCALQVRFASPVEANKVFNHFNLVSNYNGGWGLYFGEAAIEDVAKEDMDDTNTTLLSDAEVFEHFIKMYNYMNPFAEQLEQTTTRETFCENYSDLSTIVYNDYIKESQAAAQITAYIYNRLDIEGVDGKTYSHKLENFGDFQILAYKISQEEVTAYADLSSEELEEAQATMIEKKLTNTVVNNVLKQVRKDMDFEIFEAKLKLKHQYTTGEEFDNKGSKDYIAKLGETNITPKDLFDYMENRIGAYYAMEAAKSRLLINSEFYEELYGENRNFLENSSDLMKGYREDLREMKSAFGLNNYANYGFSSNEYTWPEFLYVAFSATSEQNLIEQLFVMGAISPYYIYPVIEIDRAEEYMQTQHDEYYDVFATHLLMYVDFDWTYSPDDFDDYLEDLSEEELTTYNTLKAQFEDLVNNKLADDISYYEIVKEYNETLMGDTESEYHPFKSYGFIIKTEKVSMGENVSINNNNDETLDEAFSTRLKTLYDAYIQTFNVNDDSYVDDQLTTSSFGLHFITITKGNNFDLPDASFTAEDDEDGEYDESLYNDSKIPTTVQIENYMKSRYATDTKQESDALTLPTDVYDAIDALFGPIYNAYMSQTGLTIRTLHDLLDSNVTFAEGNTAKITTLENLLDVLYIINFPEEFDRPTQD